MIAFALLFALQQPDTNTVLPAGVRAMVSHLPLPSAGQPSILVRFSSDSVWVGQQVELVTAIWFPRQLRERLRRQPNISPPSLTGLWSARNQQQPVAAETRIVGHQLYDLYVSYQTIFPLGAGPIVAPPAVLSYGVPVSTSYFAPEERRNLRSRPATLVVRAIPAGLAGAVGNGPTARELRLSWRGPAAALRVGAPVIVELVVTGQGNLTLWPVPSITWPPGIHVYPEPTQEHTAPSQDIIAGEKHFRYTIVADTTGVVTLPPVSYPYFDPDQVAARTASSTSFALPVLPRVGEQSGRRAPPLVIGPDGAWAAVWWQQGWVALLVLIVVAPWPAWRRRHRRATQVVAAAPPAEPEAALRRALGAPVDAGPDHVVAALRLRGVPRDEAEHIHRWLSASVRRRYGPHTSQPPAEPPGAVARALARLRRPFAFIVLLGLVGTLRAQTDNGASRYQSGDYAGAARSFQRRVVDDPLDVGAWTNLGAARWMQNDDVRAAVAWLNGLRLAPRDAVLQDDWNQVPAVPSDIRALMPTLPFSRYELALLAVLAWCVAWTALALGRRRLVWGAAGVCVAALVVTITRWRAERSDLAIVTANTTLHVSPQPATPEIGEVSIWSQVHIQRGIRGWYLVEADIAGLGTDLSTTTTGWIPAAAIVSIRPLD